MFHPFQNTSVPLEFQQQQHQQYHNHHQFHHQNNNQFPSPFLDASQPQYYQMPSPPDSEVNVPSKSGVGMKRSMSEDEPLTPGETHYYKRLRHDDTGDEKNRSAAGHFHAPPIRQESSMMSLDVMDTAESVPSSQTQPWQAAASHALPLPAQFQRVEISDSSYSESPSPHSLYDNEAAGLSGGNGGGANNGGGNTPGSIMGRMDRLEVTVQHGDQPEDMELGHEPEPEAAKPGRFTMGFRSDCEKCKMRVPGHWAHPPADTRPRRNAV